MPERATAIIPASALPPEIRAKLGDHPFPGARYRVTVEPAKMQDDDKLAALRDHVRSALAQAASRIGIVPAHQGCASSKTLWFFGIATWGFGDYVTDHWPMHG